ncbi:MAG TPA: hypothetical protein VJY62_14790 [Bacteroidia bacterium]|nr:hypothetical protein [Bacteroidia bacterium]
MAKTDEFVKQLGNQIDFVKYVRDLEQSNNLNILSDFLKTPNNKRYLSVKNGPTKIVDFRHFFAAMMTTTQGRGGFSRQTVGNTLLLGVANELAQCTSEIKAKKINSCFSNEDLGSNKLGADFGEILTIARAENSKETVANLLDRYLTKLQPLAVENKNKLEVNTNSSIIKQLVLAIIVGIEDNLIGKAY